MKPSPSGVILCSLAVVGSFAFGRPLRFQREGARYPECPNAEKRCMSGSVVNCSTVATAPWDRVCCPGLECQPRHINQTSIQPEYNTTWCAPPQQEPMSGERKEDVGGKPPKRRVVPVPPMLPSVWAAPNGSSFNISSGLYGETKFWFREDMEGQPAIRTDFAPRCPFLELWELGLEANYSPCSVLFYKGINYYIYPEKKKCCQYKFPAWHKNMLCEANATWGGDYPLKLQPLNATSDLVDTTLWAVQWYTDFGIPGRPDSKTPNLNIRNLYTRKNTNLPFRFREDLDTGWIEFGENAYFGNDTSKVPKSTFTDIIDAYPCHYGYKDPYSPDPEDKTCVHYNSAYVANNYPANDGPKP